MGRPDGPPVPPTGYLDEDGCRRDDGEFWTPAVSEHVPDSGPIGGAPLPFTEVLRALAAGRDPFPSHSLAKTQAMHTARLWVARRRASASFADAEQRRLDRQRASRPS